MRTAIYNGVQVVHVISAIIAVGSNVTYLYWLRKARTGEGPSRIALEGISDIDRKFANPAYVVLPITGVIMVLVGNLGWSTFWIATAIGLFVALGAFAGIVFTPALRRQTELAQAGETGATYEQAARRTQISGTVTMVVLAAIIFLMVVKPDLS